MRTTPPAFLMCAICWIGLVIGVIADRDRLVIPQIGYMYCACMAWCAGFTAILAND